jgi:hypothetical protein
VLGRLIHNADGMFRVCLHTVWLSTS